MTRITMGVKICCAPFLGIIDPRAPSIIYILRRLGWTLLAPNPGTRTGEPIRHWRSYFSGCDEEISSTQLGLHGSMLREFWMNSKLLVVVRSGHTGAWGV